MQNQLLLDTQVKTALIERKTNIHMYMYCYEPKENTPHPTGLDNSFALCTFLLRNKKTNRWVMHSDFDVTDNQKFQPHQLKTHDGSQSTED
jgi:hypothetical protein